MYPSYAAYPFSRDSACVQSILDSGSTLPEMVRKEKAANQCPAPVKDACASQHMIPRYRMQTHGEVSSQLGRLPPGALCRTLLRRFRELVELNPLRSALVGMPGRSGSVWNSASASPLLCNWSPIPSIIFMCALYRLTCPSPRCLACPGVCYGYIHLCKCPVSLFVVYILSPCLSV